MLQVPVVVNEDEVRVHYLKPSTPNGDVEFVRDDSNFMCVILLTPVPDQGSATSYLRRYPSHLFLKLLFDLHCLQMQTLEHHAVSFVILILKIQIAYRWNGGIVKLQFEAGSVGNAFIMQGSQIDHSILPCVNYEGATVLCIPIHAAHGWTFDEEICSKQDTELGWGYDHLFDDHEELSLGS